MTEKAKVACPRCGATNAFPLEAAEAGKKVVCGRCRTPLPAPGSVLEPSEEDLITLFQKSGLPILVDFYSLSCAPCLMMHPILERLAKRRAGEIMVVRVNTDRIPRLAAQFGIQAVPTFVILSRGSERGRTSGAMQEADFSLWVASRS
ncbi:MAG: conjugal transfer protein TraF [Candidatus Aminicenantes bacterium]|nr:conjugal transfer protein TraF [Candidatus Aminicenantes bacterium]